MSVVSLFAVELKLRSLIKPIVVINLITVVINLITVVTLIIIKIPSLYLRFLACR
jgi:hypothetical protein